MPMLSTLLHYRLKDTAQRMAGLDDLVIDPSEENFPPVTYLVFRGPLTEPPPAREPLLLNWNNVRSIDHEARIILVDDLQRARTPEPGWLEKAVLLRRDIQDALVLDLDMRLPVIANDLWLEEQGGKEGMAQFVLKGVDISFRAVLRRLTGGFLFLHRHSREQFEGKRLHDWRYIEFMRGDPRARQAGLAYHGLVSRLPHGEIANMANLLPYLYSAELLEILPETTAADTLEVMLPTRQLQSFKELDREKAIHLLTLMRPDFVADLMSRLDPNEARDWLEEIPREQAERVIELLHYPGDTAGGMMTNDFVCLPTDLRVKDAIPKLAEKLRQTGYINFIQFVYVVDDENGKRLRGYLSLRDVLVADGSKSLGEVMDPYLLPLVPLEKAKDAARKVIDSGMSALPVVDPNGKLLGIVTVDSALVRIVPPKDAREILKIYS
jgi:magnesium transporter